MGSRCMLFHIAALLIVFACLGCSKEIITVDEVNKLEYPELKVSSPAFGQNEMIPSKYTCDGDDISPPLRIDGVPDEALSMVIIVDDPDAPAGTWVHWVVWNVRPTDEIDEGSVPGTEGLNDFKKHAYGGPCPPSGTHSYHFKVYALDTNLALDESTTKEGLLNAMAKHIIAKGELIGRYKRQ